MKIKSLLLIIVLFAGINNFAQSYEGYISTNLPIWLDITSNDGSLSGSYFYKTKSGSIELSGTKQGSSIVLNEKDANGVIAGVFTCIDHGDSLTGKWGSPKSSKYLTVKLHKTNSSFKDKSRIPGSDKLLLAADNQTLSGLLKEYSDEASGKTPKLHYVFAERGILSCSFDWETLTAYLSNGTEYHTFNLTTNKEIILSREINNGKLSDFKEIIKDRLQKELDAHLKNYSEKEWLEIFEDKETVEKSFKADTISERLYSTYYLENGSLYVVVDNYFEFPHVAQAMDLSFKIQIPFTKLMQYINEDSIFNDLK